jgi:tetratricopeptide (TPR) repeat protein
MEAIQGLGRTYLKLGGETAARDMERIALGYNGGDYVAQRAESLKWFGIILGVRSGDETALSKIEAAIEAVGPRADLLVEVGHYWFARSDLNQARVSFSQALQADSTNADAHYGLGRVAWETRDFQIAEDHLRKYLELQPRGEHRKWVEERLSRLK